MARPVAVSTYAGRPPFIRPADWVRMSWAARQRARSTGARNLRAVQAKVAEFDRQIAERKVAERRGPRRTA